MDTSVYSVLGTYVGIAILFLIVLAILWFLLPFAVFGTKPKLDANQRELREVNAHLSAIAQLLRDKQGDGQKDSPADRIEPR